MLPSFCFWLNKCKQQMITFTLLIMNIPEGRNISHHKISQFLPPDVLILQILLWAQWDSCHESNKTKTLHSTGDNAEKETQFWTAGTLFWRGRVGLGNPCSLSCTTSKTVLYCQSHTACLHGTAKNGIGKYHATCTKLYTLLSSSYVITSYWSYSGLKS